MFQCGSKRYLSVPMVITAAQTMIRAMPTMDPAMLTMIRAVPTSLARSRAAQGGLRARGMVWMFPTGYGKYNARFACAPQTARCTPYG